MGLSSYSNLTCYWEQYHIYGLFEYLDIMYQFDREEFWLLLKIFIIASLIETHGILGHHFTSTLQMTDFENIATHMTISFMTQLPRLRLSLRQHL